MTTTPGPSPAPDRAATLASLQALVSVILRRERLADATWGLTRVALPAGLLIAAAAIASARVLGLPGAAAWAWLGLAPVPGVLLWAFARPRSRRAAARRLDRHYDLKDRIGNAIELLEHPPRAAEDPRTLDLVALVAADAEEAARAADPRPVVSLTPPGLRLLDLLAAAAVVAAALIPIPQRAEVVGPGGDAGELVTRALDEAAEAKRVDMALAEPLREDLRRLQGQDDAAARLADAMLEILDAFGAGELDREAAFASLEALEEQLAEAEDEFAASIEEDPSMLAEAARRMSEALKEHEITREAGEALARGDEEAFEEAMRRALERAESNAADRRELDKAMSEAERALKQASEQQRSTSDKLAEAERRLKRQEQKPNPDPQEQERRLGKLKERVEQLRRQHEREEAARRKLEQLRREAQQAGGRGQSGQKRSSTEKLSRGASDASKAGRQGRRLGQSRDNLEEAKKLIRRAGKQGDQQNRRKQQMQRFAKAAKGKQDKDGKGKNGKKGPTLLVEGDIGDGDPDQQFLMDGDGQGQPGDGQEGFADDGQGGQDGQGKNGNGQDGQSIAAQGGDSYGDGSQDPLGDPNSMKVNARNVRVNAKEGRGATRAEIISTASQDGFASVDYQDVYRDYESFAQNAMDRETMPAPQRRKIKRYFQMIQPRE